MSKLASKSGAREYPLLSVGSSSFYPFVLTYKMSEEVERGVFNVEPYQYEPMAPKSDPGTSDD